jgi:adenosine deaminase
MRAHLHLHLEPNERKRRQLGGPAVAYGSPARFFDAHRLDGAGRLRVSLDDLRYFLHDLHREQKSQGAGYVELRFSPRRFTAAPAEADAGAEASGAGTGIGAVVAYLSELAGAYTAPVIRLILLMNRDTPAAGIEEFESLIAAGLPDAIAGIDLAGDEIRFPDVGRFEQCFRLARSAGLGTTVHAGEFGGPEHIWTALDRLGAGRIGHGIAAAGCRSLADRLRRDQVLLEVSVSSNVGLGAVSDVAAHPLRWLAENGIPVCLNSDVPLHLGTTLDDEHRLAATVMGGGPDSCRIFDDYALRYRFREPAGPPAAAS